MRFLSGRKSMQESIFRLGGILGRSLGMTSGNSLTTGANSMEGIAESRSWNLTIWYRQPLKTIFHDFRLEMIPPLGIEFPAFHSTMGSFRKLNFTTLLVQSIEAKHARNQSIPNKISK